MAKKWHGLLFGGWKEEKPRGNISEELNSVPIKTPIDFESIDSKIEECVNKLNDYMIQNPSVIFDSNKNNNFLNINGDIDFTTITTLASLYCSILVFSLKMKKASDIIIAEYNNKYIVHQDVPNFVKNLMNVEVQNYLNKMTNSITNISFKDMPKAIIRDSLEKDFNQKCTDYNLGVLLDGLKFVINECKL